QVEKEFLKGQCACVRHTPILNDAFVASAAPHPGILPLSAMRLLPVAIVLLLSSSAIPEQSAPTPGQILPDTSADVLHDYESCTFDDGLQIARIDSLPP